VPEDDSVWRTARLLDRGLAGRQPGAPGLRVPEHATANLAGRRVLGTDTHGKHLFTRFEGEATLHTHLRMDGRWRILGQPSRRVSDPADQIRVLLEADHQQVAVAVRVPVVELLPTSAESAITDRLGPDPLRRDWEVDEAVRRLGSDPTRPLAAALHDQRLLAGLDNLWVTNCSSCAVTIPGCPWGKPTRTGW